MIQTCLASWLLAASLLAPASRTPGETNAAAVVEAHVLKQSSDPAIITLDVGRQADVAVGDPVWIAPEAGPVLPGWVYLISDQASAARLSVSGSAKLEGRTAVVLHKARLTVLREDLPPDAGIVGRVSRLTVGRETVWISLGRSSGLRLGDTVLIRREGIPIARGEIRVIDEAVALISLQPLVGNALPEPGDPVELWPAPGLPAGRINSTVLRAQPADEGAVITVVGSTEDGLTEGRLIEVYRAGKYMGAASAISPTDYPLTQAKMIPAASVEQPKEGDAAIVRSPTSPTPALRCPVFRVEEDYCLLAAGEVDGVQRGEKLMVFKRPGSEHAGRPVAEITVDKVNVDYSGAFIRPLDPAGDRIEVWDIAERREPNWPQWRAVGRVERTDEPSRTATVLLTESSELGSGDVVGIGPQKGGIVLRRADRSATVYLPPGWGDLIGLAGSEVKMVSAEVVTTMPARTTTQPAGSRPSSEGPPD